MAWLLCEGKAVASLEVADTLETRLRGLLGRTEFEGAFLITPASSVHTLGMKFPIDVAFIDNDMLVLDSITMVPNRLSRPRRHSRMIIEASAGAFSRWDLQRGCRVEVRA